MHKISLNQDWLFVKGTITMMELFTDNGEKAKKVDLPHDAMIYQVRTPDTANAHQTGFYPGGEYTYIKKWDVPWGFAEKTVILEFEGVADTCRVYVNGHLLENHYNPYTGFFVDVTSDLRCGECNEVKVEVCSVEQSSRWYSGAGLYRPVYAWIGNDVYIPVEGVRISASEVTQDSAVFSVQVPIHNQDRKERNVRIQMSILSPDGEVVAKETERVSLAAVSEQNHFQRLEVIEPCLWSDETPYLYTCRITILSDDKVIDQAEVETGIRSLNLSPGRGLLLNGKEIKLRGTCIHHDNGVIGAATFYDAEYRRCRQLKEAGFNAIRSSHHQISKFLLQACDRLGMLVMDELSDMWTRTKNPHDYANYFPTYWEQDVASMIEKDYNHPSVIMYSTGNEIPEAGTRIGAQWNRKINEKMKELDASRYTTNGVSGLMAGADRMGEMMCQAVGMSPGELEAMMQTQEENPAGADAVNGMASVMVGQLADGIATCPVMEELLDEFTGVNDIAGYNYLTALHEEDARRHPSRVVLGTETFPADIVHLWDVVKRNAHVLGDFTWIGYDYLGEAGCGIFHYDGGENFSAHWPDRLAGIGDLDILGDRKPVSYLREAVYGIGHQPAIGVLRMNKPIEKAGKTPWMWKDNIASWTWDGFEGKTASVDVYANADEVELFLNQKSFGKKNIAGVFVAEYQVPYEAGILEAVSYCNGKEVGRSFLKSAAKAVLLKAEPDRDYLPADGNSLLFIPIRLADHQGNWNRMQKDRISINIEGEGYLQGFGSANPSCLGSYQDAAWDTYDGSVMAVIRAGKNKGMLKVHISSENCGDAMVTVKVG